MDDPEKRAKFDSRAFILGKNGKEKRWPEIVSCAKALKEEHGFKKVGAVGFCYGGWAVFQLGAKGESSRPLKAQVFLSACLSPIRRLLYLDRIFCCFSFTRIRIRRFYGVLYDDGLDFLTPRD